MVNVNELRVGNWVNCIFIGKVQVTQEDIGNWPELGGDPIELTSQILELAGFLKDINGWNLPETDFSLTDSLYPCWLNKMLWPQDIDRYKNCSLQYLHQLQNICFSLTGKELEIKLNQPATN